MLITKFYICQQMSSLKFEQIGERALKTSPLGGQMPNMNPMKAKQKMTLSERHLR